MPANQGRFTSCPLHEYSRPVDIEPGPVLEIRIKSEADLVDYVLHDANLDFIEVYDGDEKVSIAEDTARKWFQPEYALAKKGVKANKIRDAQLSGQIYIPRKLAKKILSLTTSVDQY